jgi:hypothetical protein
MSAAIDSQNPMGTPAESAATFEPEDLETCPACNARYDGGEQCHRCKADLRVLIEVRQKARLYREKALAAWQVGDWPEMFRAAERSWRLWQTPQSSQLFAKAALLSRHFRRALQLWQKTKA